MTRASELLANNVRDKLALDEVVASMIVRLSRGVEIARIAATAGFDTLYVDLEHNPFSIDTAGQICIAAQMAGVTPFARVPATTPEYVQRIMDAGAMGVIAPHIRSAEEAKRLVDMVKFPPHGTRSAAGPAAQLGFRSFPGLEAEAALNAATMVIPMVETADALDQVDAIAAVEGVDLLLVGTNDLLAEMGIPGDFESPRLTDAYRRIIEGCRSRGKHVGLGGLGGRPDRTAEFVRMGARFVSTGTDLGFLAAACAAKVREVRALAT
jgi:2-keto-3-deoxy-L-rhamnonate aldolase RhmA